MGFGSEPFEDILLSLNTPSGWKFGLIWKNPSQKLKKKTTQIRKFGELKNKRPELYGFWEEDDPKLADEPYEHSQLYPHLHSVKRTHFKFFNSSVYPKKKKKNWEAL